MGQSINEQYQAHPNVKWRAVEIPLSPGESQPSTGAGSAQWKRPVVKSRKRK